MQFSQLSSLQMFEYLFLSTSLLATPTGLSFEQCSWYFSMGPAPRQTGGPCRTGQFPMQIYEREVIFAALLSA